MLARKRTFVKSASAIVLAMCMTQCRRDERAHSPHPETRAAAAPHKDLAALFADFQVRKMHGALLDFGGLERGAENYFEVAPTTAVEVARLVRVAAEHEIPLRVRGFGNSLNASSLPRAGELLVLTHGLRSFRRSARREVEMGGGVSIFGARNWLRALGYDLPVGFNGPGPSIAGFMAGGGISITSKQYGGFWDNVEGATLVDGGGNIREVRRGDKIFPWLFGSMGQLGIVTAVRLRIVPAGAAQREIPERGRIAERWEADTRVNTCALAPDLGRPYWFTVFVPPEQSAAAQARLNELAAEYPQLLERPSTFVFSVKYRGNEAPLVYPRARDFAAVGLKAYVAPARVDAGGLAGFLAAYDRYVKAHAGFHRYIQAESDSAPRVIRASFEPQVYERLLAWKLELDPHLLLNRGVLEITSAADPIR